MKTLNELLVKARRGISYEWDSFVDEINEYIDELQQKHAEEIEQLEKRIAELEDAAS